MEGAIADSALSQLFGAARSRGDWSETPVPEADLHRLYGLLRLGPTSANCCPARLVFVTSPRAKALLGPMMSSANRTKTLQAPCTIIIGYDLAFDEALDRLLPNRPDARAWFADPQAREFEAIRSGSLQAAYLIIAARALGLDCGPMAGFDHAAVDEAFFAGTKVKSNFVCSIGYGRGVEMPPRLPRLDFEDVCRIV